jgi:trans-aconitate methyltransferase
MKWQDISGWFSQENYDVFSKLKLPKNAMIVESGTGAGRSTWALSEIFPDAKIRTFDPFSTPVELPDNVMFSKCTSNDIDYMGAIHLLFIDNSHSALDVKLDWDRFIDQVVPGGYVVFHDYNDDATCSGIKNFVDKLPNVVLHREGEFGMAVYKKP